MASKKAYKMEKQNIEECLQKEAPASILCSDSAPREYEPVWGNMKKATILVSKKDPEDFEIWVEEMDKPYDEDPQNPTEKQELKVIKNRMMATLKSQNKNYPGTENLFIPEVKEYLDTVCTILNRKYGINSLSSGLKHAKIPQLEVVTEIEESVQSL